MQLKEFLGNLNSSQIPKLKNGSAKTIKEFYEQCIEKYMPLKEVVYQWDEILDKYISEPASILFVRRYSSAADKRWTDIRRGFLTTYEDDFGYVFCDNFLAHYFYTMAFAGYVPRYDDFKDSIVKRDFPYGFRETKEEVSFRAYPKGKSSYLNIAGWKLAHLYSVNQNDYNFNYKKESSYLFPRGEQTDWTIHPGKDYPERKFPGTVTPEERQKMIAHFLRVVHPINYFLVPMQKYEVDDCNDDIGEVQELINYVYYRQKQNFPDIFNKFEKNILAKKPTVLEAKKIEDTIINITYGRDIKKVKEKETTSFKLTKLDTARTSGQVSEVVSELEDRLGQKLVAQSRKFFTSEDDTFAFYFIESNTKQPNGTNWFDIHEEVVRRLIQHRRPYLVLLIREKGQYFIPLTDKSFLNNGRALVDRLTDDLKVETASGKYKWPCFLYSDRFAIRKKQFIFYVESDNIEKVRMT